jgi:hypothetical protein
VEELQTEFQYSGNAIGTDTLQWVFHNIICCVHLCKEHNGHHFQQIFWCQFLSWIESLFEHAILNQNEYKWTVEKAEIISKAWWSCSTRFYIVLKTLI